jgi:hypothetical protein
MFALCRLQGTGASASTGDGGPAVNAAVNAPYGVALDKDGNLYLTDTGGCKVRRVDAGTGFISTVAGTGTCGYAGDGEAAVNAQLNSPVGLVVDDVRQRLFIADNGNHRVRAVDFLSGFISTVAGNGVSTTSGDGGSPTAAGLNTPWDVEVDPESGDLYIAEFFGNVVRKVVFPR